MSFHDYLCFLLAGLMLPAVGASMLYHTTAPCWAWVLAFTLLIVFKPRRTL